jgi:hypothetical protein
MMNDVDALWSSAWRKLQKHLASGLGETPVRGKVVPAASWLIRARSRKTRNCRAQVIPTIQ